MYRSLHREKNDQGQQGFSLIELLVALVIVTAVLGTVFQLASVSMGATAKAEEYIGATELAQNLLQEVGLSMPLEETVAEGTWGIYRWSLVMSERVNEGRAVTSLRLFDVACRVEWGRDSNEREIVLQTVASRGR